MTDIAFGTSSDMVCTTSDAGEARPGCSKAKGGLHTTLAARLPDTARCFFWTSQITCLSPRPLQSHQFEVQLCLSFHMPSRVFLRVGSSIHCCEVVASNGEILAGYAAWPQQTFVPERENHLPVHALVQQTLMRTMVICVRGPLTRAAASFCGR